MSLDQINNMLEPYKIENNEKDILLKFCLLFKKSLEEFSTYIDRSLGYLDKIILPTIMASKSDKSYNPFSEIIEKYVIHILSYKLEKEGYYLLPLGYSADLTLENKEHILSIDIKTANLDNPSDFQHTINIGINQMTHTALLSFSKNRYLPNPILIYPTIPPFYIFPDGNIKIIYTYGLIFIYPSYKDLIENIRKDYYTLYTFFKEKVENTLKESLKNLWNLTDGDIDKYLNKKTDQSKYTRQDLIVENIIRGIFIHEQERNELLKYLNIDMKNEKVITKFLDSLRSFTENLRKRDIKPIAIIAIAIPNGLLKEKYIDKFVSGKNYSKSARFHYEDGIFEIIKEKTGKIIPRVIFLDINENYLEELKKYFENIIVLDFVLRSL